MQKINKIFQKTILLIFIVILGFIFINNIFNIYIYLNEKIFYIVLSSFGLISYLFYKLYKNHKITHNFIIKMLYILFSLLILYRIFTIFNTTFILESDFKLYYTTAMDIIKGHISDPYYLSYNGYVYIFSTLLAIVMQIFGSNINILLLLNLGFQICTCYFIYKIIKMGTNNRIIQILFPIVWFLMPSTLFANLLISTENLFLLLFVITIYFSLKLPENLILNKKTWYIYVLFGIIISFANNIRPVMLIFIIALTIYYILSNSNIKKYFSLLIIIISFLLTNILFTSYIQNGLGTELRSGAQGWSYYFGSNYSSCGQWTIEDSNSVFSLLKTTNEGDKILINKTIDRYKELGLKNSALLFGCKFKALWTDNNSTYVFADLIIDKSKDHSILYQKIIYDIVGFLIILILLVLSILNSIYQFKNKKYKFLMIQLFLIGYVIANLLVVLNGRYSLPVYPLLIILSADFFINKYDCI